MCGGRGGGSAAFGVRVAALSVRCDGIALFGTRHTDALAVFTLTQLQFLLFPVGCEECATHFAAMAATREYALRTMTERGGRERHPPNKNLQHLSSS